jgi:hypothetical protein
MIHYNSCVDGTQSLGQIWLGLLECQFSVPFLEASKPVLPWNISPEWRLQFQCLNNLA